MSFAKPQTVANELFVRLERLFDSDNVPDNFAMLRLEKEANALQRSDASDASMVKAGIAVLRWDLESAKYWVENSLRLKYSVQNLLNAALTYKLLCRFDLACGLILKCYELAPKNMEVVIAALEYLGSSGRFKEAEKIYLNAAAAGVLQGEHNLLDYSSYIVCMQELGISSERLQFEIASAHQVLFAHHKRIQSLGVGMFKDHDISISGVSSLVIEIGFYGNITDELRLESELAFLLADKPDWNPCVLSTELHYFTQNVNEST